MKNKRVLAASAALILAGSMLPAEAQWGGYRNPYGYYGSGGGHGYRPMATGTPYGGYGGYYRRHNGFNGGTAIAGLVGGLILGGLMNAAVPGLGFGAFGGLPGAYGAYDPYGYGYQPGYPPYPVVYRPVRQRIVYMQRAPRYQRVHMRARMVGYR